MREWRCPGCGFELAVDKPATVTPYHPCSKAGGLKVPMVLAGVRAKLTVVERGDWVGGDTVTLDSAGRAVQAVITTRDDGQDCTVYAPLAKGSGRG